MPGPVLPEPSLIERVVALEVRLAALEADVTRVADEQAPAAELERLRWFMKHGRRRPW